MEAGKVIKRGEDFFSLILIFIYLFIYLFINLFIYLFIYLFIFCFSLLKTTETCFGSTKMGIFYRQKTFHAGKKKKTGKMTLPPQKNMPVTPLWCGGIRRARTSRLEVVHGVDSNPGLWGQFIA